jgi:formylglycine-generating enzyme required for sulfatase activity
LRHEEQPRDRVKAEKRVQQLLATGVKPVVPAISNSLGMRLVLVPPGVYFMGSPARRPPADSDEFPRHLVRIVRPFYLGATAVTQQQYETVMGVNPSYFGPQGPGSGLVRDLDHRTLPVESVSYRDTLEFCRKLSARTIERRAKRTYRLPQEAEWEYACRGCICHAAFCFGSRLSSRTARFGGNDGGHPVPVASFAPNLFGLHDMHGNVWEWCQDWYDDDYYSLSPEVDPPGPKVGQRRVLRGGGWSTPAELCRSALRGHNTLDARHNYNGFRVAVPVAPSTN